MCTRTWCLHVQVKERQVSVLEQRTRIDHGIEDGQARLLKSGDIKATRLSGQRRVIDTPPNAKPACRTVRGTEYLWLVPAAVFCTYLPRYLPSGAFLPSTLYTWRPVLSVCELQLAIRAPCSIVTALTPACPASPTSSLPALLALAR